MCRVSRSGRSSNGKPADNGESPISSPQTFALVSLLADRRRYAELDLTTLTYHVEQSDATAGDGYWHASINEARSALEALVVDVVRVVGAGEATRPPTSNGTPFSNWRRFLVDVGFLDAQESDLLHFVYGLSSAKGSHHGVPDEDWSRLARRMVFCAADYVLRRYTTWKQHGLRPGGPR
ncbi:MAG: hypothetical protein PVJ57_21830 [Phycisphaerae bacterium]|jgi:hypothetical protein